MTTQLKPCPFCGSDRSQVENLQGMHRVICMNIKCGAIPATTLYSKPEDAIECWNDRVIQTIKLVTYSMTDDEKLVRDALQSIRECSGTCGSERDALIAFGRIMATREQHRPKDGSPSYDDLALALIKYQEHTGQKLEDTLAGRWTNAPYDNGMTLPELPEGWSLSLHKTPKTWFAHLREDDSEDDSGPFDTYNSREAYGPTPSAAVLAAIAKIKEEI